jgi:hypothetical protein
MLQSLIPSGYYDLVSQLSYLVVVAVVILFCFVFSFCVCVSVSLSCVSFCYSVYLFAILNVWLSHSVPSRKNQYFMNLYRYFPASCGFKCSRLYMAHFYTNNDPLAGAFKINMEDLTSSDIDKLLAVKKSISALNIFVFILPYLNPRVCCLVVVACSC